MLSCYACVAHTSVSHGLVRALIYWVVLCLLVCLSLVLLFRMSHGSVGAYTAEERARILKRFYAKRERRIWKKKIRYTCRKNLADRRIRVKGRFVKADDMPGVQDGENEEDEDHPEALGPLPTLPALGNGTVTRSSGRARSVSVSLPLRR